MKTFDYEQVNAVLTPLKAKFDDCSHGEGNSCETLDKQLDCCATICFEVVEAIREWAQDVFSGAILFDPAAEKVWRNEAEHILSRAVKLWQFGRKAELLCYELPGQEKLSSALWHLAWLLNKWVSPQQAVGPAARSNLKLTDEQREKIKDQLCSLPPRTKSSEMK